VVTGTSIPAATDKSLRPDTPAANAGPITSTESKRPNKQNAGTNAWLVAHGEQRTRPNHTRTVLAARTKRQ
jgi:hypothetical protein